MSDQFIDKKELLALKTAPLVAWPTVMLFIGCLSSFGFATYCTLDGSLPLWTACILNGLITYFMFSVVQLPAAGQLNSAGNGKFIAGRRATKNLDFVGFVVPGMLLVIFKKNFVGLLIYHNFVTPTHTCSSTIVPTTSLNEYPATSSSV